MKVTNKTYSIPAGKESILIGILEKNGYDVCENPGILLKETYMIRPKDGDRFNWIAEIDSGISVELFCEAGKKLDKFLSELDLENI